VAVAEPMVTSPPTVETRPSTTRRHPSLPPVDRLVDLALLAVVGLGLPLAVAAHYHSLGSPSADDWAYDQAVYRLAAHGHLYLFHWARVTVVGQVLLGVPAVWLLGPHNWALNGESCLMGMVGLVSLWYLARKLGLGRRSSLLAAATLGLGPMWSTLSTTFMDDVPALAMGLLALAVAASDPVSDRLLTRRSLLALVLAAYAFTMRDQLGVVFAAVALGRAWRNGRPNWAALRSWAILVATLGAAMTLFYAWRQALPSGGGGNNKVPVGLGSIWYDHWFFPLLGLALSPVAAAANPWSVLRAAWSDCRRAALLAWGFMPGGPILLFVILHRRALSHGTVSQRLAALAPSFGNYYFSARGLDPQAQVPFLPPALAVGLGVVSACSLVVIEAVLVLAGRSAISRLRAGRHGSQPAASPRAPAGSDADRATWSGRMLGLAAVGGIALFLVVIDMQLVSWDRYILDITAFAGVWILHLARRLPLPPGSRSPAPPLLVLAAVSAVSLVATVAADGYTGGQWTYSNRFAASVPEIPAGRIYTDWVWTSTRNLAMVAPDDISANAVAGYQPCYWEVPAGPTSRGLLDVAHTGSWVQGYSWGMERNPALGHDPSCHFGS
jgi:hypothetical protein